LLGETRATTITTVTVVIVIVVFVVVVMFVGWSLVIKVLSSHNHSCCIGRQQTRIIDQCQQCRFEQLSQSQRSRNHYQWYAWKGQHALRQGMNLHLGTIQLQQVVKEFWIAP